MSEQPTDNVVKTQLTEDEKINYFKAFISDKPYTAKVELLNGEFRLVFKALTIEESSDVFLQLKKDQDAGRTATDAAYLLELTSLRLALSLVSINEEPFQPQITKATYTPVDDTDSYVRAKAAIFTSWAVFKLSAVADTFKEFEDKVLELTKAIQEPNFWQAAKSAS